LELRLLSLAAPAALEVERLLGLSPVFLALPLLAAGLDVDLIGPLTDRIVRGRRKDFGGGFLGIRPRGCCVMLCVVSAHKNAFRE
jgi:hypothetical protein